MVLHRRLPLLAAVALTLILLSSAPGSRGRRHRSPREERRGARFALSRRQLVGPGSSPPTCRSRCGTCHPCRPIHVAIQPGLFAPMDYYPEAWRCTCGHKLFMP